jgi:hypothetical protein
VFNANEQLPLAHEPAWLVKVSETPLNIEPDPKTNVPPNTSAVVLKLKFPWTAVPPTLYAPVIVLA